VEHYGNIITQLANDGDVILMIIFGFCFLLVSWGLWACWMKQT